MSLSLTPKELFEITGKTQPAAQLRKLRAMGIRAERSTNTDQPVVVYREWLSPQEPAPAFDAAAWFKAHREKLLVPFADIASWRLPFSWGAGTHFSGIYFLFTREMLVYVGQARSIAARLHQHAFPTAAQEPDPWLTHYSALEVSSHALDAVESYYLHLLRPPRNAQYRTPHELIADLLA